jgi:hypothetical protein
VLPGRQQPGRSRAPVRGTSRVSPDRSRRVAGPAVLHDTEAVAGPRDATSARAPRPVGAPAAPVPPRPTTRSRSPLPRRLIGLGLIGGALVGAVVGAGVTTALADERADALLDLSTALAVESNGLPSTDQADRFVQSELLYLNSATFAQQAGAAAGADQSSITASQVGNTDVVRISAQAGNAGVAVRVADAGIRVYDQHRRSVLTGGLSSLEKQLTAAQAALADTSPDDAATKASLQTQISALQAQVDQVRTTGDSTAAGGTVVESASAAGAYPTTSRTLGAIGGLAVGALLGLGLAVGPRLLSRRIRTAADVDAFSVRTFRPALPATPGPWSAELGDRGPSEPLEAAARLLAGRLSPLVLGGAPLAVVGATQAVGTTFAAVNLAVALARRRPTVLV